MTSDLQTPSPSREAQSMYLSPTNLVTHEYNPGLHRVPGSLPRSLPVAEVNLCVCRKLWKQNVNCNQGKMLICKTTPCENTQQALYLKLLNQIMSITLYRIIQLSSSHLYLIAQYEINNLTPRNKHYYCFQTTGHKYKPNSTKHINSDLSGN